MDVGCIVDRLVVSYVGARRSTYHLSSTFCRTKKISVQIRTGQTKSDTCPTFSYMYGYESDLYDKPGHDETLSGYGNSVQKVGQSGTVRYGDDP